MVRFGAKKEESFLLFYFIKKGALRSFCLYRSFLRLFIWHSRNDLQPPPNQ